MPHASAIGSLGGSDIEQIAPRRVVRSVDEKPKQGMDARCILFATLFLLLAVLVQAGKGIQCWPNRLLALPGYTPGDPRGLSGPRQMRSRTSVPRTELLDPETVKALAELDALAHALDTRWRVPFTTWRFGLDAVAGLVPVVGDAAAGLVSLYLVLRAANRGVSVGLIAQMLANVAIDATVGSVPLVGTIFDVYFKANRRNVDALRRHIATKNRRKSKR